MANQIKIDADISKVRKSLLDISREVKNLGGKSKVSLFDDKDKKFLKQEMKVELQRLKSQFKENRDELVKLVNEQKHLKKGTEEELKNRKAILKTYQDQSNVVRSMSRIQGGAPGGGGGGVMATMGRFAPLAIGAAAVGYGLNRASIGVGAYRNSVAGRASLAGLGVNGANFGGAGELGSLGLAEGDLIDRMMMANRTLGRGGGSLSSMKQQAAFERAMGLEGGSLLDVSTSLRSGFGGRGADQAQAKIQASILAAGIEDALAPYLEATTSVLSDINEQGMRSTDDIIKIMARSTANGSRTPEQIANMIRTIDASIKGATGERGAFIQDAFARNGIGGGTVGGVMMAMEGGVSGFSETSLRERRFNSKLIANMRKSKMLGGSTQDRLNAIMGQIKSMTGVGSISDITDTDQMGMISRLANNVLGTQGLGGFDALQLTEKLNRNAIDKDTFDKRFKAISEGTKDPVSERLEMVNSTLGGHTQRLQIIAENTSMMVGKATVGGANMILQGQTAADAAIANGANAVTGAGSGSTLADRAKNWMNKKNWSTGNDAPSDTKQLGDEVTSGFEKALKRTFEKWGFSTTNKISNKVNVMVDGKGVSNNSYE